MNFNEMFKLRDMLESAGIPYTFSGLYDGVQIRVYMDKVKRHEFDDAILHSGSHGYNQGLLETYHLNECEGFETAEQVFAGWSAIYNGTEGK